MPVTHMVDVKTKIMHVRRWGSITTQEEEALLQRGRQDPTVAPNMAVLIDCREVDSPDSTEAVTHLADRANLMVAELDCEPMAIVVSSDVQYGMARMYMTLTESKHPDTRVFRNHQNALKWLRKKMTIPDPDGSETRETG